MAEALQKPRRHTGFLLCLCFVLFFKREGKEKSFISQPAKLNSKKNPLTMLANMYVSNAKKLSSERNSQPELSGKKVMPNQSNCLLFDREPLPSLQKQQ